MKTKIKLAPFVLFLALAPLARATDIMGLEDPVGGKQDVFQIINYPAGVEYSIHGVEQLTAPFIMNVTISGGLINAVRIPIVFPTVLSAAPVNVEGKFWKNSPSEDNVVVVTYDTPSAAGIYANLSGPAIAGQTLHCTIFAP